MLGWSLAIRARGAIGLCPRFVSATTTTSRLLGTSAVRHEDQRTPGPSGAQHLDQQTTLLISDAISGVANSLESATASEAPAATSIERPNYPGMYAAMRSIDSRLEAAVHTLHVHASPNNTILTLADHSGRVLINCSGGTAGFRKAQRSGPEAAYQATQQMVTRATERGIKVTSLHLRLNGFGQGRDAVFRAVRVVSDWPITRISDATPIAFNGCRPRKKRRL